MEAPECSICCEGLNDSSRRPRFLPCGHTICTICVDKSIDKGDKTCPNCRQPHHATATSNLPINYALEEVFQNFSVNSSKKSAVIEEGFKQKTVIPDEDIDTKVLIHSIETAIYESQSREKSIENQIENHQAHLSQKSAEMERLVKDIQEKSEEKQCIKSSITELEEKRKFFGSSFHKIQIPKTNPDRLYPNLDEDIESDLHKKNYRSRTNYDSIPSNIVQKAMAVGLKTDEDSSFSFKVKTVKTKGSITNEDSPLSRIIQKFESGGSQSNEDSLKSHKVDMVKIAESQSNEESFKSQKVDMVKIAGSRTNEDSLKSHKVVLLDSLQSRKVVLVKAEDGLGIGIVGGNESDYNIYISTINKGTGAHKNSGLRIGDRLLTINREIITGYSQALDLIRKATGFVVFEVRYMPIAFIQMKKMQSFD